MVILPQRHQGTKSHKELNFFILILCETLSLCDFPDRSGQAVAKCILLLNQLLTKDNMKMNLKNSLVLIVFTVCIASVSFGITESNPNKNSFNELTIRGGLPNFFSKALIGDSIKVAYLGGSITAQNGWRVLSL